MGVIPCSREGCRKVMCEWSVDRHWNLCQECYDEIHAAFHSWPRMMTTVDIRQRIEEFIQTPKRTAIDMHGEAVTEKFEAMFTNRYEDQT